jgi:hypothetical protein
MEGTVAVDGQVTRRPKLVLALASPVAVGVLTGALLALPAASRVGFAEIYVTDLMIGASFTTIGALVARPRPENPMETPDGSRVTFKAIGRISRAASVRGSRRPDNSEAEAL